MKPEPELTEKEATELALANFVLDDLKTKGKEKNEALFEA